MNLSLSNLTRLAVSQDSVAWGSSLVLHLAGAAVAWSTLAGQVWDTAPELPGRETRVELLAHWSEPTPPQETQPQEIDEPCVEIDVVVTPSQVKIDRQIYRKTSTHVSRPEPSRTPIESPSGQLPSIANRQRSSLTDEAGPQIDVARESFVQKKPLPARMPAVEIPMPASVPVNPSVTAGDDRRPQLIENRPPDYPPQAVADRLQGMVLLRIHISSTGNVARAEIIQSTGHPLLDAAAVRAVVSWRFIPARRHGKAVPATVRLPVRFSLD